MLWRLCSLLGALEAAIQTLELALRMQAAVNSSNPLHRMGLTTLLKALLAAALLHHAQVHNRPSSAKPDLHALICSVFLACSSDASRICSVWSVMLCFRVESHVSFSVCTWMCLPVRLLCTGCFVQLAQAALC